MINPQKAVEWYKQRYNALGLSDYEIYESIKKQHVKDKDGMAIDYAENPFTTSAPKESNIPTEEELNKKANPGFVEKFFTMNLTGAYADESDWWAEAYNKSIAGTLYQAIHGEAKYEVGDVKMGKDASMNVNKMKNLISD